MAIEISTWEELLSTVRGEEYSWVGGSLNFDDIQPAGFAQTVTISGSIDFNGAVFFNFRSFATIAISRSTGQGGYTKNITFQNIEHLPVSGYAVFLSNLDSSHITQNIVIDGSIAANDLWKYTLIQRTYWANSHWNKIDSIGTNLSIRLGCPFRFVAESNVSDPSQGSTRFQICDSRIKLDLEHTGDNPFPYVYYNCKISGKIRSTSDAELKIPAYYSAVSVDSDKIINCPNLNLVRTDLAEYSPNSRLVECEAPFYEYKEAIADSGFPYNGAVRDGGD